jgi:hypothetical protein
VSSSPLSTERGAVSAEAIRALEAELGARVPDGLRGLTDAQLCSFTSVLHDATRRQSAALESAIVEALKIVPPMLRWPVRKILFG